MKTILLATDFSLTASNAADYAADMALALNADLVLLHTYQMPVIYLEGSLAVNEQEMKEDAEMKIERLRLELSIRTADKVNIRAELKPGNFFRELTRICDDIEPYAVVLGSQGTSALDRFLFGSHVAYAMKHLRWPLITVPPNAKFNSIKKIGLAWDFKKLEDTSPIDEILLLVKDFNAELHVLNIRRDEEVDDELIFQSSLLKEMLQSVNPHYHFLINVDTDAGIIDFTEKCRIDLLIVLPRRHKLLHHLIFKSLSRQLVLHSHIPVLDLHANL